LKMYENAEGLNTQRKALEKCLKLTWKVLKVMVVFYAVCFVGPTLLCLINFLAFGSVATPFPVAWPFLEPDTRQGFISSYPFHFVIGFAGWMCFASTECSNIFVAMQTQAFVDVVKCNLDELELEISKPFRSSRRNIEENISKLMKAVVESHRDLRDYHELLLKRLIKVAFIIIAMNTYTVCACGIAVLVNKYYTAAGIACVAYSHERLKEILWNFEWYKLPKCEQKSFLLLMMNAQMPLNLEPLFVGVIDMELFLTVNLKILFVEILKILTFYQQISDSIYSFFMIMWNLIH
jgi:7tm Odorant receptor